MSKKQKQVDKCIHNFVYEQSTPKGDYYRCTECGKRVHEIELNKYA